MENGSPDTYLLGQQAKGSTFNGLQGNSKSAMALGTTLPRLEALHFANQERVQTTADQGKSDKAPDFVGFILPAPFATAVSTSSITILHPRQSWEGTVIESGNGSFVARVSDRTNPSYPDEIVTFDLDEISQEDRELVVAGSSFYWTIGTERSPAGQVKNIDMVNFRRLPQWKEGSIREAEQEAMNVLRLLLPE
jgi:hypothetical protein